MKKLLSLLMAIAMVASLASTAFAEDPPEVGSDGETVLEDSTKTATSTVKSKIKAPTIKVTVPTTNYVYLNPYKMSVTVGSATQNGTIVSIPGEIKSESDVKLDFSAVVTGKAASGVTLEKAPVGTKTTNSVYMFVYFATAADESGVAALAAPTNPVFSGDGTNAIVVQTTASKSTKVLTLDAAPEDGAKYGGYVIGGDIVAAPATPWTAKHTVDVTIAFSIAPVQATDAGTGTGGTGGSGTENTGG